MKQITVVIGVALTMLFWSGCAATLTHVPSRELQNVKAASPVKVVVVDVGDARGEAPNAIGFGVSYWLPQSLITRETAPEAVCLFPSSSPTA